MKQINYTDKSKFGNGPWQNEADSYSWIDEKTKFHCVIWREPEMGHLCGYVGVCAGSPLYSEEYDELYYIEVHGGLTFSGKINEKKHRSELFDKNLWYLGFDCAHANDLMPLHGKGPTWYELGFIYRDFNYVKSEIESLCRQLDEWENQ